MTKSNFFIAAFTTIISVYKKSTPKVDKVEARSWRHLPVVMAVSAVVLLLAVEFGAFAGKRPEAVEEIAAMIHANRLGGEPIGEYKTFVRNLPFYTHIRQVPITDDTSALTFLKSTERVFLVLHEPDLERLKTLSDVPLRTIGQVTYLEYRRRPPSNGARAVARPGPRHGRCRIESLGRPEVRPI